MGITINSNIAALRAQTQLGKSTERLSSIYERLSSGVRINRASDDAAGLSIADSLRSDSRMYSQGVRNLNDGMSALSIAQGALGEFSSILGRLGELAEQAANGTYSATQRSAMDTESSALVAEYNRIVATTSFNGVKLLDGSINSTFLQAGYSSLEVGVGNDLRRAVGNGTLTAVATFTGAGNAGQTIMTDLNGDGNMDVAVVDGAFSATYVYLGNGDLTFKARVSYSTSGNVTTRLVATDVNNDGYVDLVTTEDANDFVNIFINNGNGTFKARATMSTGTDPKNIVAADLNGDGNIDLISASSTDNMVNIAYGLGNGSFQANVQIAPGGAGAWGIDVGDLDGDGRLDIAITSNGGGARILLQNSDGSFKAGVSYRESGTPQSVDLGDLDGDGDLDMVIASGTGSLASVLLNNGNGTFKAYTGYDATASGQLNNVVLADLNDDGSLDIVGKEAAVAGYITVLLGNGNGTFKAKQQVFGDFNPANLAVGDLNNDGIPEVTSTEVGTGMIVYQQGIGYAYTLQRINLTTQASAKASMSKISDALTRVNLELGGLGSHMQRIQIATNTLFTTKLNYEAAGSRIRDADLAEEAAEAVRYRMLQEVGASILAQSTKEPEIALKLLGV